MNKVNNVSGFPKVYNTDDIRSDEECMSLLGRKPVDRFGYGSLGLEETRKKTDSSGRECIETGCFKDGLLYGRGTSISEGSTEVGFFKEGKLLHGKRCVLRSNGVIDEGTFDQHGMFQQGTRIYQGFYQGFLEKGIEKEMGIFEIASFKEGTRYYSDGQVETGIFGLNGKLMKGTKTFSDGTIETVWTE